ncbi:unnamed protein product [Pleuronectes platessa]|uniref:Uncharacterized protein n=1 Tax=Pleuronectes platessa TaxID=8262 RepID=A0A9N7V8L4_PLEPL|nr:unnamed protein product [Pleuronectes platessa]
MTRLRNGCALKPPKHTRGSVGVRRHTFHEPITGKRPDAPEVFHHEPNRRSHKHVSEMLQGRKGHKDIGIFGARHSCSEIFFTSGDDDTVQSSQGCDPHYRGFSSSCCCVDVL